LSIESVGSRRQLVANCVHTADADATKQFRRVVSSRRRRKCVLGFMDSLSWVKGNLEKVCTTRNSFFLIISLVFVPLRKLCQLILKSPFCFFDKLSS